LDGCKGAWGNVNDMFAHVRKELHLKNFLVKNNPEKYVAAMPKNLVFSAADEYEAEHGGRDFRKRQLELIKIIESDREYMKLVDSRPKTWSAPSRANANLEPFGHRGRMTLDDVDRLLGIKKFVPKTKTSAEEFQSVHKNMR